jgi:Ca2+-binding EF-hand superfamily protein
MKPSQCLSLSLLLLSVPAFTQGPDAQRTPPPRPIILALDTDHDGKFSIEEIAAASVGLISLDADHDGQLTSLEYLPSQSDPAANKPDETVQRLMSLDKNGDGTLTKDEVPERLQGLFARTDTNHDDKLTPDEIRASASTQAGPSGRAQRSGEATRMDPVLAAIDTNHDGIISKDEIAAAPTTLKSLDKDGDGQLSASELRPRQQTPSDRAKHMLDEWDTNKDGKLTKPEAPDRIQQQFDAIDTNHDRVLDEEELVQYFTNMPQQPGRPQGAGTSAPNSQGPRP